MHGACDLMSRFVHDNVTCTLQHKNRVQITYKNNCVILSIVAVHYIKTRKYEHTKSFENYR